MADKQENINGFDDDLDDIDRDFVINEDDLDTIPANVDDELPKSLIVTNVDLQVFEEEVSKETFENIFKEYESNLTFCYLKNFRRVRVNYSNPAAAANAKINLHETEVLGQIIKIYFVMPLTPTEESDTYLHPPKPQRMFLISPPASPPVDWEPVTEAHPCIHDDIVQVLANLAPGEAHELHPESEEHPGIVVHVCEDPVGYRDREKLKILQTSCPSRT